MKMKNLIRVEEFAQFALCLFALILNHVPWWAYIILLIGPDISMLGYLINPRVGAISYNFFHHKAFALLLILGTTFSDLHTYLASTTPRENALLLAAIILYGHASMDRIFGYGLKFGDNFQHTHLGWIGKQNNKQEQ